MASKRGASSDLNHDNWNQEDEPEESGTFKRASDESLKGRVIKAARRRNPISSITGADGGEKKSAFTGFSGFGKDTPTSSAFSFLSNLGSSNTPPKVNGTEEKSKSDIASFKFSSNIVHNDSKVGRSQLDNANSNTNNSIKSSDYYSKLKGLNQSVSNWIKKHVDANPLISLQPIFKDYEKYFNELENEKDSKQDAAKSDSNNVSSMSMFVFKPTSSIPDSTTEKTQPENKKPSEVPPKNSESTPPKFSFGPSATSASATPSFSFGTSSTNSSGLFSFGKPTNNSTSATVTTPSFSFEVKSNPTTTFSNPAPFTFGNAATKPANDEENKEADDDEEPPKNDFTPVIEEDHIYMIRCKVFVKKDNQFGDRGVGNLFLKPIKDSEKVQLIVRADTKLGNIVLNLILSESIPTKRLGNKDVMLVCVPTPSTAPPPVPVLLRVKSSEQADELLQTLEKHKK
ncbi:unnamed protein product [Phyllotreta striolata]|uniref:RanBD1 domain-containing protein n=1 Tax=Phyllotreta striolata TaxID=444603 RepID=A0A9N9TI31_PHYSR|nr:unnamed protein product [Phyllotreta striolata]